MTVVTHEQQFQVGGRSERSGSAQECGNQGQTSAEPGGNLHLGHVDKSVGRLRGSGMGPVHLRDYIERGPEIPAVRRLANISVICGRAGWNLLDLQRVNQRLPYRKFFWGFSKMSSGRNCR